MSEELKSPDAVSVCFVWFGFWLFFFFFYFILSFVLFVFTGVLHSNIYIGRDFFCALILSNYGNTSWQIGNRTTKERRRKKKHKVSGHEGDALDNCETFLMVACSLWGFSLDCKLCPSRSPLWRWRRSGVSCSLQSERCVTRLSRRGGRGG